ncbi:MAG: hypothetical protein P8J59_02900 [Phycisphaerales bacterium]|nr:hypothetical protein [Phycisphaerales bacterium]
MISLRYRSFAAAVIGGTAVFAGDVGLDTIFETSEFSKTASAQQDGGRGGQGGRGGRGGGRGGMGMGGMRDIRELLEPDFSRRDVPLFVEQLQLDDGQRAIIESLIEDYDDTFGGGSEAVQADLTDLGRSMMQSFMGGGAMGDMRERMRDTMGNIREEMEEIQAANGGQEMTSEERRAFFRERMQTVQQDMMQDAMESGAMDEARGVMGEMLDILQEWVAERQLLKTEFVGNVEIQLSDDQLVLWPAFDRFLVREKSLPRGRLSGEEVNLFAVLDDVGLSESAYAAVEPMLDEYEIQLHSALVSRDAYLLSSAPRLFKAIQEGSIDDAERILKQQVQYREGVRNVNDNFRVQFADVIEDEMEKQALNRAFLEEAYDRIYRPTFGQRSFSAAMEIEDLDPDVLEAIMTLDGSYMGELSAKNLLLVNLLRKSEGDDQVSQGTRMVSVMSGDFSGGMPWGGGRNRGGGDEEDPYREGMDDRTRIDERYVEQLRALLTPEQQEALPTQRGGRGGGGGGWGGGASEEQRAEFMKRFDKDGDGELSDEERQSMIEEFRGGRGGQGGRGGRGGEGGRGGQGGGRGGQGGRGGVG